MTGNWKKLDVQINKTLILNFVFYECGETTGETTMRSALDKKIQTECDDSY